MQWLTPHTCYALCCLKWWRYTAIACIVGSTPRKFPLLVRHPDCAIVKHKNRSNDGRILLHECWLTACCSVTCLPCHHDVHLSHLPDPIRTVMSWVIMICNLGLVCWLLFWLQYCQRLRCCRQGTAADRISTLCVGSLPDVRGTVLGGGGLNRLPPHASRSYPLCIYLCCLWHCMRLPLSSAGVGCCAIQGALSSGVQWGWWL